MKRLAAANEGVNMSPQSDGSQSSTVVQFQAVLYANDPEAVERSLESIAASVRYASSQRESVQGLVRYGDAGPKPVFSADRLASLKSRYEGMLDIDYVFFGENTGYGRGQNMLAKHSDANYLFAINPDVVFAPRCLDVLLREFDRPDVGIVEAKQIPVEHPKSFDPETGVTSWASGACMMVRRSTFDELGGFDAETFFMYCEDVDFSWRVRLSGLSVVYQPAAVVFHDKRFSTDAEWVPTRVGVEHSAVAALLLMNKWSRDDLADAMAAEWKASDWPHLVNAATEYERRIDAKQLPDQLDPDHRVGFFDGGNYAKHRYTLIGG